MSQIENFIQWNQDFKLGFTKKEIDALPEEHDGAILTWSLPKLGDTIKLKVEIMKKSITLYYIDEALFDNKKVRLLHGKPSKYLKWTYLDMTTNRGRAPADIKDQHLAGLELLDLACQSPHKVKEMNGNDKPYWDLGGIQFKGPGEWSRSLYVHGLSGGDVSFGTRFADDGHPYYAEPVVVSGSGTGKLGTSLALDLEARVSALENKLEAVSKYLGGQDESV